MTETLQPLVPAGPPPTRRRLRHRVIQVILSTLTVGLVAGAFIGVWQYLDYRKSIDPQFEVSPKPFSASDLAAFRSLPPLSGADAAASSPLVITYHDISPKTHSQYVVTPQAFAAQMRMLRIAGYHAMTAEQFTSYVRGSYNPPPRSILITFDDGTAGLWRYADRVLAREHLHAVSFVITGRVGRYRPYYLTWREIETMHRDGHWDFESHTHNLHSKVPIGPHEVGSALSNPLYRNGHYEPRAAFVSRVQRDLELSIHDLEKHHLPRPTLFAYPFSDVALPAQQQRSTEVPKSIVAGMFATSFVDYSRGTLPATRRAVATGVIERYEVTRASTARSLFDALQSEQGLPVRPMDPLRVDSRWLESGGYPAPLQAYGDTLRTDMRTMNYVSGNWAPQRTGDWSGYAVSATVAGLQPDGGQSGGLSVRALSSEQITASLSANQLRVSRAGSAPVIRSISGARHHLLTVRVTDHATTVAVDGKQLVVLGNSGSWLTHGGIGAVLMRAKSTTPFPWLAHLRVEPTSSGE